jgi:hypothetical protein
MMPTTSLRIKREPQVYPYAGRNLGCPARVLLSIDLTAALQMATSACADSAHPQDDEGLEEIS